MPQRKFVIQKSDKPSGVPSWDIAGFGPQGKLPIKFAGLENSVELERVMFRLAMDAIKESGAVYWIENSSSPPPAYIYRFGNAAAPQRLFAVAVYPRNKPAQYFMILERISVKLREIIERVVKGGTRVQSRPVIPATDEKNSKRLRPIHKPGHSPTSWGRGSHRGTSKPKEKEGKDAPVPRAYTKTTNRAGPSHPWRRK